jgi:hypothetical protein
MASQASPFASSPPVYDSVKEDPADAKAKQPPLFGELSSSGGRWFLSLPLLPWTSLVTSPTIYKPRIFFLASERVGLILPTCLGIL